MAQVQTEPSIGTQKFTRGQLATGPKGFGT